MRMGMNFCPKCGTVVAGSETEKKQIDDTNRMVRESTFMWLKFLLIIYAIPVIIVALIAVINADTTANAIFKNPELQPIIIEKNITFDMIKTAVMTSAVLALISGLCAGVTLVLVSKRRLWLIAFILCIVASVLSVWNIIGLFIGLFVAWLIFDVKDSFDQPAENNTMQE